MMILDVANNFGCGDIPGDIKNLVSIIITVIKIVVPILLIVWGMLDLGKAVIAQKEDEIKKGQQTFIKRLIAAVIVFLIPTIVELVVKLIAGNGSSAAECIKSFL